MGTDVEYRRVPGAPNYLIGTDGSLFRLTPIKRLPGPGPARVVFSRDGRQSKIVEVRRLVLETFVGPCPEGMEAVAADDNPDHCHLAALRWDYRPDAVLALGSWKARGELHGHARLTEAAVTDARRLHAQGWSIVALAERYGVSANTIRYAVRGQTWRHIPPPGPAGGIEPSGHAKLSDADIAEARRLRANGTSFVSLAKRFRVTQTTISHAVRGKRWRAKATDSKGAQRGSDSPWAKLTEAAVIEARRLCGEGWAIGALAERYGVSRGVMVKALRGETWAHVEPPAPAS